MNSKEFSVIRLSFIISTIICAVKFVAYFLTHSLVILSDALESIINVVASALRGTVFIYPTNPMMPNILTATVKLSFSPSDLKGP